MAKSSKWPIAIIDIGSNSIRMVIFKQGKTEPSFNKKVYCALGKRVDGKLDPDLTKKAFRALKEFQKKADKYGVKTLEAVGTASLREASDGGDFVRMIKDKIGLKINIVDGEEEAKLAARGILSKHNDAAGTVFDLGGGSLDIALITDTQDITSPHTLPIGTLRLKENEADIPSFIGRYVDGLPNPVLDQNMLYLVGGSFRAFSKAIAIHYKLKDRFSFHTEDVLDFAKFLKTVDQKTMNRKYKIDKTRVPHMANVCLLLEILLAKGRYKDLHFCRAGIRDGVRRKMLA